MIKQIVEHIKSVFSETGFFQTIYPLCVLDARNGSTMPVHYVGNGNMEPVAFFSNNEGVGYFRKINDTIISPANYIKTRSCDSAPNEYSYQLKFIACIPKIKAECDDEYSDDYFANVLVSAIDNIDGLSAEIGAKSSNVSVVGFKTSASEVYQGEFGGKPVDFPFNYSLIAITISAIIIASSECFEKLCYGQTA